MVEYAKIKEALETKLDVLEGRVDRINEDLSQPHDNDWADKGSDLEGDEAQEEIGEMAEKTIAKIKFALSKIKKETYGICEECGEKISTGRLEALPYAVNCIKCTPKT
jgi:RNA polymerase-binding protein DksA